MYILMSHEMTEHQYRDAKATLDIEKFDIVPSGIWSQIPSEFENIDDSLVEFKKYILQGNNKEDYLLVQGDYGATFNMVQFSKEIGMIPIYATSKRKAYEVVEGDKVITVREFEHVRFRRY